MPFYVQLGETCKSGRFMLRLCHIYNISIVGRLLKFITEHKINNMVQALALGLRPGGKTQISTYTDFGIFVPFHVIQPRPWLPFTYFTIILALVSSK